MKNTDLILSKVVLEDLPNDGKIEILGHVFTGIEEISKAVEVKGRVTPDFRGERDLEEIIPEKPIEGLHILELYQPYPCFDSYDSLYENRRYRNFFFSTTPFSMERINEIANLNVSST